MRSTRRHNTLIHLYLFFLLGDEEMVDQQLPLHGPKVSHTWGSPLQLCRLPRKRQAWYRQVNPAYNRSCHGPVSFVRLCNLQAAGSKSCSVFCTSQSFFLCTRTCRLRLWGTAMIQIHEPALVLRIRLLASSQQAYPCILRTELPSTWCPS
jgi:hypothetical protein